MRERSFWMAWMPSFLQGSPWQLGTAVLAVATSLIAALAAARSWTALRDDSQSKRREAANDSSSGCCGGGGSSCGCESNGVDQKRSSQSDEGGQLEDLADDSALPDPGRKPWRSGDVSQRRNHQQVLHDNDTSMRSSTGQILPGRQRIFVKTYGCAHNSSDSEFMMGLLRQHGYTLTDDWEEADSCLINSCTVKNPSQDTAVNLVQKCLQASKPVVLAGCVPSADKELADSLKGVSMLSVSQIDRVVEVVEEASRGHVVRLLGKHRPLPTLELPKVRKNQYVEIIPISGGCLGNCSYCKTVHARGKLMSYSEEEIVARALSAAAEGVSEVWLTSEDTGAYGIDLGTNIASLLRKIADALPPNIMLKLGMTNPPYMLAHIEAVAEVMNRPNVFAFLHVPVQSGSDTVLRAMVREYTSGDFRRLVDGLKARVPDMLIATDIICGFPAEAEEDHQATLDLVQEYKFPVLHISQFYPRPGTPAARLKKLSSDVVKHRSSEMTKLFDSYSTHDHLVGREERVWFSDTDSGRQQTIGHTKSYVKVVIKQQDELLGKSAMVRLSRPSGASGCKWHLDGEVIGA